MFSLTEIDHVVWFLLLLMGGWMVVTVLVDLSGGRTPFRKSKDTADDRSKPRD